MTPLGPDDTWLDMPEAAVLREIAGGVLALALLASVAILAVGSLVWALERAGVVAMTQQGLARMGRAMVGAVVLGGLSGLVGFGARVFALAMG
ncbi:hypothetical protein OCAE111667_16500 [Occultella aeris]|uniref:Uncharacterized protein n=1 Tax=Occultella aeris TaxID=2761496 RepID=A0A7M4DKR9_9MICO|nr:hypothetical protein [Occultella aeris]VZO37761.1 hypothetical protein HALOF300_02733 [Occultella aeris]